MANPAVQDVPVESALELGAVVSLDDFDLEGKKRLRRLLLPAKAGSGSDLDVDLDAVAG